MKFLQHIGSEIFTKEEEPEGGGYPVTVISVALEDGCVPYVSSLRRPLTKSEVEMLIQDVAEFYSP